MYEHGLMSQAAQIRVGLGSRFRKSGVASLKEEEMENADHNSSAMRWVPLAVLLGTLAGFSLGLLYAPKEGKETRRYLRENAARMREQARERGERVRENLPFGRHKEEQASESAAPTE